MDLKFRQISSEFAGNRSGLNESLNVWYLDSSTSGQDAPYGRPFVSHVLLLN